MSEERLRVKDGNLGGGKLGEKKVQYRKKRTASDSWHLHRFEWNHLIDVLASLLNYNLIILNRLGKFRCLIYLHVGSKCILIFFIDIIGVTGYDFYSKIFKRLSPRKGEYRIQHTYPWFSLVRQNPLQQVGIRSHPQYVW